MESEADANLIRDALFILPTWTQSMLHLGTIWLISNNEDPRALLESIKKGSRQPACLLVSVTRHLSGEHVSGAEARIELFKKCLRSWDWADEDAHELMLVGTNVTLNIGDLVADRNSAEYRGIRVDLFKLITPTDKEGTLEAMRPHPTYAINSGAEDFTLMGFEDEKTYVLECPEQQLYWEFVMEKTPALVPLPTELWHSILDWVPPLDRQSFSLTMKSASLLMTTSQRKTSSIWATIFWSNEDVHRALKRGVRVALVGNIEDIGKKQAEKAYLFLVTLPLHACKWQNDAYLRLRGKLSRDMMTGASTYDYPKFTINVNGFFGYGRPIEFPETHLHQFSSSTTSILHHDSDQTETALLERYNAPHDRVHDILIHLRDNERIHLRSCFVSH